MNAPSKHFRYTFDPLCLSAAAIYVVGRFALRPHHLGGAFVADYLNDVLCLPIFLPVILWLQRRVGLRTHDDPPRMWELLQAWLVFSIVFEVILPRFPQYFRSTSDPIDVLAYLAGGWMAYLYCNRRAEAPPSDCKYYDRSRSAISAVECSDHDGSQVVSPS